jgi:hypothetical protein
MTSSITAESESRQRAEGLGAEQKSLLRPR